MADEETLLTCYNRGCGKKYDPLNNNDDSCRFHPGEPFFHDAYKGWTCCSKKCTDFTEFLNIPGCTLSKHSNVKPPEPEKPQQPEIIDIPEPKIKNKPIAPVMQRTSFTSTMTIMKPTLASSVKQITETTENIKEIKEEEDESVIKVGTPCKNGGCKQSYEGPLTDSTPCVYHPGVPVFHEGLKYWSCCTKRTTDFQTFLNQVGCTTGSHLWHDKKEKSENIECRWDWHQTGNDVVVSIYAKEYCPMRSVIKLNPVRLYVDLLFPKENDGIFNLDLETRGIIDVEKSSVTMYGTKVEIKLRKAEFIKWEKLDIPRPKAQNTKEKVVEEVEPRVEALDLDDL